MSNSRTSQQLLSLQPAVPWSCSQTLSCPLCQHSGHRCCWSGPGTSRVPLPCESTPGPWDGTWGVSPHTFPSLFSKTTLGHSHKILHGLNPLMLWGVELASTPFLGYICYWGDVCLSPQSLPIRFLEPGCLPLPSPVPAWGHIQSWQREESPVSTPLSRAKISQAKRQPDSQVSQKMGSWPKASTELPVNRFSPCKSRNPPWRLCARHRVASSSPTAWALPRARTSTPALNLHRSTGTGVVSPWYGDSPLCQCQWHLQ